MIKRILADGRFWNPTRFQRLGLGGNSMPIVLIILCLSIISIVFGDLHAQRRGGDRHASTWEPGWSVPQQFKSDTFTFVRIKYYSFDDYGRWGEKWKIDWPDAEQNLTYRLSEMTSLKVNPQSEIMRLTDERLKDFPFIYMIEPGGLKFDEQEVVALREYLLNGGFLMVDDFWGDYEYQNFESQIRRVFKKRPIIDLTLDHEIFNTVFPLKETLTELPQIPNVGQGYESQYTGVTWEPRKDPGAREVHYRAILNDEDRIMVMICHNTDLGDGWEREGDDEYFFREFSEKKAYPLGINIIFYAMTH